MLLEPSGVYFADLPEGVLDQALAALGDGEPVLRASLLSMRALHWNDERSEHDAEQAHQLASALRLPDVEARLLLRDSAIALAAGDHASAIALAEDAEARFRALDRAADVARAQDSIYLAHVRGGTFTELERLLRKAAAELKPGASLSREGLTGRLASLLLLRCDPDLNDYFSRPLPPGNVVDLLYLPWSVEIAGDPARALRLTEAAAAARPDQYWMAQWIDASKVRLLHEMGDLPGARAAFAPVRERVSDTGIGQHGAALALQDALPDLVDSATLATIADRGWDRNDGEPLYRGSIFGSFDRLRARWALALDRLEEAERLARRGLEWCERERLPVEEGRCHQLLAEVLRRKGDDLEAARHLDAATALFQRHGARLYLDQALEQRALLKA